ncbi:hypothetical protein AB6A40_003535 [Gnathostoma spinigerum]|uniref:tRNA pseudouridine synthase n=1 Tax=Gnathostoma spinigerum TaxID=75299 RepID=A0ABD6EHG4_9BILA
MALPVQVRSQIVRYLFWISYDGSCFPSMAKGGSCYGLMNFFTSLLQSTLLDSKDELKISASSRTDAGVHACRNSIIVQLPQHYGNLEDRKEGVLSLLNQVIRCCNPASMKILDFHKVSPGFCVRRNVSYRHYVYRICEVGSDELWERTRILPTPLQFCELNYAWMVKPGFDIRRARDACSVFRGTQNMASFFKHPERERRKIDEYPCTLRNLLYVDVTQGQPRCIEEPGYKFHDISVISRSFLREQVRRMVSVIVGHAYGNIPLESIQWLLRNPMPSNFFRLQIRPAPAHGLYLKNVVYDHRMFANPIPYHQHSWDYDL